MSNLGEKIKKLRSQLDLTQEQLALKSGISKNAIWNYENNKREPSIDILNKISKVLNVNFSYFIDVDDTLAVFEKQVHFKNDMQYEVFKNVLNERHRQDSKWGEQNHFPQLWTGILGEEYGELCEAINETVFDNGTDKGGFENMRKEAIHVAAVAIGFLECLERNKYKWFPEVENE